MWHLLNWMRAKKPPVTMLEMKSQRQLECVSNNNSYFWTASYFCFFALRKKTERYLCIISGKDDIEEVNCTPGYVCYRSDWNISSSLSPSNHIQAEPCKSDNKILCIIPRYDDICSDLTTTFTSGNCSNSFSLTKSIPVGMYSSVLLYFELHLLSHV